MRVFETLVEQTMLSINVLYTVSYTHLDVYKRQAVEHMGMLTGQKF